MILLQNAMFITNCDIANLNTVSHKQKGLLKWNIFPSLKSALFETWKTK